MGKRGCRAWPRRAGNGRWPPCRAWAGSGQHGIREGWGHLRVLRPLVPLWWPEGKGERRWCGRREGGRAWAAPVSCPRGLRPAPVSFPTGQGCAGARLCPGAGGQRDLTLLLLSFCSSQALKELWVGALLG